MGTRLFFCKTRPFEIEPHRLCALNKTDHSKMTEQKILIPVVGFENAGKSTVINALLQGEYSQASLLVCTKAVYHFPIDAIDTIESFIFKTVSQINQEVKAVNARVKNKLTSKWFPIKLRTPLCQNMMENTQLEIVDVPGWKESSASQDPGTSECVAKDYITSNWNTFGLVLVVLDLTCSNEEARTRNKELLRSLSDINKGKEIPVLILGNKVDAFEDDGMKEAIEHMRADIDSSFHSFMPKTELIVLSAKGALYYRYAKGLDYDDFISYYEDKMDQIGKSMYTEIGWERKSRSSRRRELLDDLQDSAMYDRVMSEKGSNFGSLLTEINVKVGGQDNQRFILKRVLELKLGQFSLKQRRNLWLDGIISVSKCLHSIGVSDQQKVVVRFWEVYSRFLSKAVSDFEVGMDFKNLVQATGTILEEFKTQIESHMPSGQHDELKKEIENKKWRIANQYFVVIRKNFNGFVQSLASGSPGNNLTHRPKKKARVAEKKAQDAMRWEDLTAFDWKRILLALAQDFPSFHFHFPAMGKFLGNSLHSFGEGWGLSPCAVKEMEQSTKGIFNAESCEFVPNDPKKYAMHAKLKMGDDLSVADPDHWGHIPWLVAHRRSCCEGKCAMHAK